VYSLFSFVACLALSFVLSVAASGVISGLAGIQSQTANMAVMSGVLSALLLVCSAVLLRREGASLADLGLPTNAQRVREVLWGFAITAVLFLCVALAQSALASAHWTFEGTAGAAVAARGLVLAGAMVLAEELMFRGMLLRSLRQTYGDRTAIVLTALLFGAYHLIQSGDWAMGAVFRFVMPTIGGLLFGWAAVRSSGLSLPIGLHLGGNWVQGSVVGFVTDGSPGFVPGLWSVRVTPNDVQLLTAPDLLPHLPQLAALALAAVLVWRSDKRIQASYAAGSAR